MHILEGALYLAADLAAIGCLWTVLRFIFLREPAFPKAALIALGAALCANAFAGPYLADIHEFLPGLTDLISFGLITGCCYALFRKRRQAGTFFTVLVVNMTGDMLYALSVPYITERAWVESVFAVGFYAALGVLVFVTARKTPVNVLPQVFATIPKWIWAVLLLFEETCHFREFGEALAWYNVMYAVSSAGLVLCVLYLVFRIFYLSYRQNAIIAQLDAQKNYGEALLTSDEELRRFRHDYKNHMIVVNALLAAGKTDEARDYLASVNTAVYAGARKISTGNFVADAILNHKYVSAASRGVTITCQGVIPSEGVRSEDLCTVLANLLDNAVEGCEGLTQTNRTVYVDCGLRGNTFFLTISNPTTATQANAGTTKADKRSHGIGLKNVRRTLKQYEGDCVVQVEKGLWTVMCTMELQK